MKKTLLLLFLFISSVSVSFSALQCPDYTTQTVLSSIKLDQPIQDPATGQIYDEIPFPIPIALLLVCLFIAVAYMIGTAIEKPEWVLYAKDEVFHLGFTMILIILFGSLVFTSCSVASGFFSFTSKSLEQQNKLDIACYGKSQMLNISTCYLTKMEKDANNLVKKNIQGSISNLMGANLYFSLNLPLVGGSTVGLNAYKRTYSLQDELLNGTYVIPALISISLQRIVLQSMGDYIRYLIPIAILFRIISATRQMGNILLAFCICFFTIVPLMYGLSGLMYDVVHGDAMCNKYSGVVSDFVAGGCGDKANLWQVATLIPQAYFLPNLSIAIFITCLSAAHKALRVIT